jgi:glutathione S-transferase
MPRDVKTRARARQIMRLADAEIYKHLVWGVYVPWKNKEAMPGLERADIILGELQRLAGESWMAGDQFSLADAYVYPMLTYFSIAPEGAAKLAQFARLTVWMEQMRGRKGVISSQFSGEKPGAGSL